MIDIVHRFTRAVLFHSETAKTIAEAVAEAQQKSANLRSANLTYADLRYADLRYADLTSANLRSANGINKYLTTPLLMLLDQPGTIRAYKLVTAEGIGPYNGGIKYEIGQTYKVSNANTDPTEQCGAGINLATLDWCMREGQ